MDPMVKIAVYVSGALTFLSLCGYSYTAYVQKLKLGSPARITCLFASQIFWTITFAASTFGQPKINWIEVGAGTVIFLCLTELMRRDFNAREGD